jgi:hypothetical protein
MSRTHTDFPPVLRAFAWALALMMAASLVYTVAMSKLLHTPQPYGFTYFSHELLWLDFRTFQNQSLHFRTPAYWDDYGYPFTYPALVAVIFGLLYALPKAVQIYVALLVCGFTAWLVWFVRGLASRGIDRSQAAAFALIVLAASWPVFHQLDTANIEGMMAIALAIGVLAVLRGRTWLGATLIGIAISMKMFPFILLGLLFSKRRYKEFAFSLVVAAGLTWASLAALGPSVAVAQHNIDGGIKFVKEVFMVPTTAIAIGFSHALFSPVKFALAIVYRLFHPGHDRAEQFGERMLMYKALKAYMAFAAVTGLALYFGRLRRMPMLNQVTVLTTCAVVLTPFSSDYTLCHLLIPFALLCFYTIETHRTGRTIAGLQSSFVCLCFILGYESFFTIKYPLATPVRTFALVALLITALRYPWPWLLLDGPPQADALLAAEAV